MRNGSRKVLEVSGLPLHDLEFLGTTGSRVSLISGNLPFYPAPCGRADRAERGGSAERTDLKIPTLVLALRALHPELFAA